MKAIAGGMALAAALALAGCTSTQDVLEPSALVDEGTAAATLPAATFPDSLGAAGTPQPDAAPTLAAAARNARIQFAPVVGAPGEASAPLAARLSARAGERGISLAGSGESGATHVLKGYFSAISDNNSQTTVIYVWDVIDSAGNRVHRIQGQARSTSRGDGWEAVQAATMESIADQTVDQLIGWLAARQG